MKYILIYSIYIQNVIYIYTYIYTDMHMDFAKKVSSHHTHFFMSS